ncbi:MAG: alpha/beta hydrolase [Oscillospiraceae bacterium]|nr:alpha/beta hydrolase [Oscillospiraceae bacterium]
MITITLIISFVCFYLAFYAPKNKKKGLHLFDYGMLEPYRDTLSAWSAEAESLPHTDVKIKSFDGLTLCGKFYEYAPDATVELLMHGYRGTAERDLCGAVQRCFALGHSALIVDQRACGNSEGRVITFGVKEYRDCLSWVEFLSPRRILLGGISMGASTVLIAAGKPLPENVVGVLADCGYSSAREIICTVIRGMHLPPRLAYPFVRLGARLFGGFDPDSESPLKSLETCTLPVVFLHGEADDFVPCDMSRRMYEACPSKKKFISFPKAGHGMSYLVDGDRYLQELKDFWA